MKKTTLTKKLLKFILPLLVFPILLLSFFYYQYLTHLLTDETIELSKSALNKSDDYLQYNTKDTLLPITIIDKELNIVLDFKEKDDENLYIDDKFLSEHIQKVLNTKETKIVHFEKKQFIVKPLLSIEGEIIAFSIFDYKYLLQKKLAIIDQAFLYILFIIIFIIFISIILTIIFSFSMTHSIKLLIEESRRVIKGDLSHQIEVSSNDEVGELVESFNSMIEKRRNIESDLEKNEEKLQQLNKNLEFRIETALEKSHKLNERLELALLGNHDGIFDLNLLDNSVYYSPRWKEMLGYRDDELPNTVATWEALVHPEDKERVWAGIHKHINGETEYYDGVHRLKHKDGSWIWIRDRAKAIFDENGKALRMIGTHTDITQEKALQLKYIQQAQIIEQIHDSVNTTDMDGFVTSWNRASEEMFGYSANEIVGKHISMLHLEKNLSIFPDARETFMQTGEFRIELELITKSKKTIFVLLTLSLLRDENGTPTNIVGYSQDISKRKKAEAELKEQKDILHHQAHHDSLTGLPNRLLFNDRLEQAIEKAKRSKTNMALLFIDLDHFKEINDSLGHAVGDEILKDVTKRLQETIREEDTLARLGGDEFTIIVENLVQGQDASLLAQKILQVLSEPIIIESHELSVSSSIGLSLFP